MNDLSSITDRILADARADAEAILAHAQKEADGILLEGQGRAAAHKQDLCDAFQKTLSEERARALSDAAMREKSRMLAQKAVLIARCIEDVQRRLAEGYATRYAPFFLKLMEKGATNRNAKLVFSASDPDAGAFYQLAKARYAQLYPDKTLEMERDEALEIGGFILKYDHLSSPCTAQSVVDFYRLQLETRAAKLLFETEKA